MSPRNESRNSKGEREERKEDAGIEILLDFAVVGTTLESANSGHELEFTGATQVNGPRVSSLGRLGKALRIGGSTPAKTNVANVALDNKRFTVRSVIRAIGEVKRQQIVVASDRFPITLGLEKGATNSTLNIFGAINTANYEWRQVDTLFRSPALRTDTWLSVDLVYDLDTLALFVGEQLVDIQAFPYGDLAKMRGGELYIGGPSVESRQHRFKGDIAALQVIAGVPETLKVQLDEARTSPAWHISRKRLDIDWLVKLGNEASAVRFDQAIGAYVQEFSNGLIMYHDSIGLAFAIHGEIWNCYKSFRNRATLGYLISDVGSTTLRGALVSARKSLFSKGGIYWSSATGAHPVLGQIYLDYESMGEASTIGLPTAAKRKVPGGTQQAFQLAHMFHQSGRTRAHTVRSEILTRFLASGGVGKWGFPVSDEVDVLKGGTGANDTRKIGRSTEFQWATLYWSKRTGVFEVHGDIRIKYLQCGGPAGDLGFPTSDELNIPGVAGVGKMNTFEKGSICWYGHKDTMVVARPFKIYVGRVSTRENEAFWMGQNDLYTYISATDSSQTYDKRHPKSGDWGENNSKDINLTIPLTFNPNKVNYKVSFRFKCFDEDPGSDDHLGTMTKHLNAANGWGFREESDGVFKDSFAKVRSLTWALQPTVEVASLSEVDKWWVTGNPGTKRLNYEKYGLAFRDVDNETEWWDVSDWLEKAFYEIVIEDLAAKGNCFGMSLEGVYARKNRSVFGMPLSRFKTWSKLESEFNIKHCYQVGAQAIWWFVEQFITGNTHDPKDVFMRTRESDRRGEKPVVCIAQNYDFSGSPHCIMPINWDEGNTQWTMDILDPNFPRVIKKLYVDPRNNTYRYTGSVTYSGGEWSGGRFHYMPYDILDSLPRTPVWDAILLILAGTVIIFGSDSESVSINDPNGRDLDAFGDEAKAQLQRGEPVDDYFFGYRGFAGDALAGGILLRHNPLRGSGDIRSDGSVAAHATIGSLSRGHFRAAQQLAEELRTVSPAVRAAISNRTAHMVMADEQVQHKLSKPLVSAIAKFASANREGAFDHKLRGKRKKGKLEYVLCSGLMTFRVDTDLESNELVDFNVRGLGSSKQVLAFTTPKPKLVDLIYETRLGAGKDRIKVEIIRIAAEARIPIQVNVRPGIGGFDLITSAAKVEVQVNIKAYIAGKKVQRAYTLPVEGGVRIQLGPALDQGDLSVGRIDRIFGPLDYSTIVRPR